MFFSFVQIVEKVNDVLQNIFFCVLQKKEKHAGLQWHDFWVKLFLLNKLTFTTRFEGPLRKHCLLNFFELQFSKPLSVIPVQLPVSFVQFNSNPAHELKGSHFFSCEFCPALLQKNRMCRTEEMWSWQLETFLNGPAFTSWAARLCIPQT